MSNMTVCLKKERPILRDAKMETMVNEWLQQDTAAKFLRDATTKMCKYLTIYKFIAVMQNKVPN